MAAVVREVAKSGKDLAEVLDVLRRSRVLGQVRIDRRVGDDDGGPGEVGDEQDALPVTDAREGYGNSSRGWGNDAGGVRQTAANDRANE